MNRKIYIDCGFYQGTSLEHFKRTPEYTNDFIYYGFDPMMNLEKSRAKFSTVNLDNKALWTNDGEITFYVSRRHSGKANSVYHNKRAGKGEQTRSVPCIDFSKWLSNNFNEDDYIILKMDIEGAEYEVIPKLLKDGTINLIDVIYLEWHSCRVDDNKWIVANELITELKKVKGLQLRGSLERYLQSLIVIQNKQKQIAEQNKINKEKT